MDRRSQAVQIQEQQYAPGREGALREGGAGDCGGRGAVVVDSELADQFMAIGTGKVKRQTAGYGAFAVVVLDCELSEHPVPIGISDDAVLLEGEYYVPAVQFGVRYAQEKLLGHDST